MENKLIVDEFNILDFELHENYKSVRIIDEKANFPISWLNTQGYCEYSLYLEYCQGVSTAPTREMLEGTEGHFRLEENLRKLPSHQLLRMLLNYPRKRKSYPGKCL